MYTVWHADKHKITFKLVINSRRISRGPSVEKHWCKGKAINKHSDVSNNLLK